MLTKSFFAKQIGLVLDHLHDFVYLRELPVIAALGADDEPVDSTVRRVQKAALEAIERLNPDSRVGLRAKERRPYAVAYGRYVQGIPAREVADELAISIRQLRREHKRAVNAIVDLLWEQWQERLSQAAPANAVESTPNRYAAATAEAETLIARSRRQALSLCELVDGVLSTLGPLAASRDAKLVHRLVSDPQPVYADRIVLRQGLLELVAYALDRAVGGTVVISERADGRLGWQITASGMMYSPNRTGVGLGISHRLISSAGGQIEFDEAPGVWRAQVYLTPVAEVPIIIADDNASLIELYRRYLAGYPYRIWPAATAEEIFRLLPQVRPALILLDVMMPEQDGWETLVRLRATEEARTVPIVICSVLNEPEIAHSLGATDYLTKPVTQHDLLAKLDRWSADHSRRDGSQERLQKG